MRRNRLFQLRLTDTEMADLSSLADFLGVSASGAMRYALHRVLALEGQPTACLKVGWQEANENQSQDHRNRRLYYRENG